MLRRIFLFSILFFCFNSNAFSIDLLPSYDQMKDCYYVVTTKFPGAKPTGPFKVGKWKTNDQHFKAPYLSFDYKSVPGGAKGSLGFKPEDIMEIKLVCKGDEEFNNFLGDDLIADIGGLLTNPVPFPITPPPGGTDPGDGSTPIEEKCENGLIKKGEPTVDVSQWILKSIKAEDPYKHYKKSLDTLADAAKNKLWGKIKKYFEVGSAAHLKCYVYGNYEQTTTITTPVELCVNGIWISQPDEVTSSVEKGKLRLHFGGIFCHKMEVFTAKPVMDKLENTDWGVVPD